MKNTIKLIGTQRFRLCAIALLAVIGFSFAACGNGTTDKTKFEGKWVKLSAIANDGYTELSYTFSGSDFVLNVVGPENYNFGGTFDFTDTVLTFTYNVEGQAPMLVTQAYALNGNTLQLGARLSGPIFSYSGDFIKQ